jgi:GT2 family glycosyltransferase
MLRAAINLVATEGVEQIAGALVARSPQPWLRIVGAESLFPGHWIRIRYRSSFWDDPVRPLLCFKRANDEALFHPLNGPILGAGQAIVRAPDDTLSVLISPVATIGRFDFAIDSIERVSRAFLLGDGLVRNPAWALAAAGAALLQARHDAQQALYLATDSTPLQGYDAWHRALARPLDLNGIDRPRSDWRAGPHIRFIMALEGHDDGRVDATLNSLRAQVYSRWSLHALTGSRTGADLLAKYRVETGNDRRLAEVAGTAAIEDMGFSPDDRVAVISAGDTLPESALAAVAETIAADPAVAILYGDEDAATAEGVLHSPRFKPDWSPVLQSGSSYLGRLACIRCADIVRSGCTAPEQLLVAEHDLPNRVSNLSAEQKVVHLRRILYRRRRERDDPTPSLQIASPGASDIAISQSWPTVTVVIPSLDRAGYLNECVRGLKELTDYPRLDVVVVDNGSTTRDAVALLAQIEKDRHFRVLRIPGPFNYSALCNQGAASSQADVLVLLNNDIAMIGAGWLKSLVVWTMRPDIGAVGAKLFYASGRIQHAGIVLGWGGRAGHLYRNAPPNENGYLDRLKIAHEVAAVTGACLAVTRSKFEAVGGLDAEHLPVDLNDVDLCLRLSERGWRTIWTPDAVLYHLESGTRGRSLHAAKIYARERAYFVRRWRHVIRDDPYFHPALSLFSRSPALTSTRGRRR